MLAAAAVVVVVVVVVAVVVHFVCSSWGDSGGEGRSDLQKKIKR